MGQSCSGSGMLHPTTAILVGAGHPSACGSDWVGLERPPCVASGSRCTPLNIATPTSSPYPVQVTQYWG
jgi:hypothetical protein